MVTDPEGDHINSAGLPSRKLPMMGKEPPPPRQLQWEGDGTVRKTEWRGFDKRPIYEVGSGQ